jgi:hypothetical protein
MTKLIVSFRSIANASKTLFGSNICLSLYLSVHPSFDIIFQTVGAIFLKNLYTKISLSLSGKLGFQPKVESYRMLENHK